MQAMDVLTITLTIAGAAALINLWLSVRVSRLRYTHKVSIGDGGKEEVATRMRSHANFAEYTPIFLILLALVELARGSETWLWAVGIVFVLGRLAHPFGMDRPAPNALRIGGMIATYTPILILAAYALSIPYTEPRLDESIASAATSQAQA
jgi:uncharacterized membrane protein YecN with MAPEG domain